MSRQDFFGKSFEEIILERENELERIAREERAAHEKEVAELEVVKKFREEYENRLWQKSEEERDLVSLAIETLTKLPDFGRIQQEFNSISDVVHKIEYIDRIVYERLTDQATILQGPQTNTLFHYRLREVGLPLLCPYLKLDDANKTTHQDCTIDEETIMSVCDGRYDICKVFSDRMGRAAQGLINIRLPAVKLTMPRYQECLVDLEDLNDWWRKEGKYG